MYNKMAKTKKRVLVPIKKKLSYQESHSVMQISDTERLKSSKTFGLLPLVTRVRLRTRSGHGKRADVWNDDQSADEVAPKVKVISVI
jgi:hypothetical protein